MRHILPLFVLILACNTSQLVGSGPTPTPTPTPVYITPCAPTPTPGPTPNVTANTQCLAPDGFGHQWCCGNADWQETVADPDHDYDARLCGWICAQTLTGPQEVLQKWDFESLDQAGAGAYLYGELDVTCCSIGGP
jgi:hypothetical protein